MPMLVEDGSGYPDAESYVSASDCAEYCDAHGLTFSDADEDAQEAALRRATAYLDSTFRGRFIGRRVNGRAQALEWPRRDAYDAANEEYVGVDEVPQEIIIATCEAAVRELAEPGSLAPDLERGGAVKRLKAGSVEVEYAGNASASTTFTAIDNALAGLLTSTGGGFVGRAVRG